MQLRQFTSRCLCLTAVLCATELAFVVGDTRAQYSLLSNAPLCINSNYIVNINYTGRNSLCAFKCDENANCRAFSTDSGWCQLFVFDECSKSVKDCSCSRRGQVFVKQQPGLAPGALCPPGYTDDLCGVKYKMFNTDELWKPSRARCEAESGLVIMADVMDATEMAQVDMLYGKYAIGSFFLGGYQAPGSPEPAGGWYWVACNLPLNPSLWGSGEPDNGNSGRENAVGRWSSHTKLADFWENSATPNGVLCECLSPFD